MDDTRLAPILGVAELRAVEARHAGDGLMERAGAAAAGVAQAMLASSRGGAIVVLAGPGNNGGDGFVLARILRRGYHDVQLVFRGDPARLPADARAAHAAFASEGGTTIAEPRAHAPALVIDALYGIGLARPLDGADAKLVDWANARGAPILALDVPTGLDAWSGALHGPAIRASATATFIALKPGLLTGEGPDTAGAVSVHTLGLDADLAHARGRRLDWATLGATVCDRLGRTRRNVHKGTFGTVGIVGGATGMTGAPILAGRAAMRVGAGKVRIGFVASSHPHVDWAAPELMLGSVAQALGGASALVAGPGMGTGDASANALRRAIDASVPLVLDADALNLVAASTSLRESVASRGASTLATPHPAEAARLLGTSTADVQRDRLAAAASLAQSLRAHVVLKGAGSVLAHPDDRYDVNASGNPGLAAAGSGDVLAGMLGALLAQGLDAATALRVGVCLHGAAADRLVAQGVGPIGIAASELADAARDLLNRHTTPTSD
ncbi:MAG: NAD(P)H-hydrate dehydratase [Betaproteobacteria bacterium]